MSEEQKALSYMGAMSGCFRGTAVFPTLIGHSFLRTLWHTALTVVLLGVLTAVVQIWQMSGAIGESAEHFEAVFGGIAVSEEKGVVPGKKPEESHYLLLNQGGLLTYSPAGQPPVLPEKSRTRDYRYTIFWYPSNMVFVLPSADGERYAVSTMKFGGAVSGRELCDRSGLEKILQKAQSEKWTKPEGLEANYEFQAEEIILAVKCVAAVGFFGVFFFEAWSQILMCLLIFVGFFALTSGRSRTLKWKELVRIAMYAGCPALAVAACFMALDLTEILSFGTVYVIGTIGYFLVIVNKIEQARHTGQA